MATNNNVNIISASLGTVFANSIGVFISIYKLSAFYFPLCSILYFPVFMKCICISQNRFFYEYPITIENLKAYIIDFTKIV